MGAITRPKKNHFGISPSSRSIVPRLPMHDIKPNSKFTASCMSGILNSTRVWPFLRNPSTASFIAFLKSGGTSRIPESDT